MFDLLRKPVAFEMIMLTAFLSAWFSSQAITMMVISTVRSATLALRESMLEAPIEFRSD